MASNASRTSMISLSDFFTVPLGGGSHEVVEDLEPTAGGITTWGRAARDGHTELSALGVNILLSGRLNGRWACYRITPSSVLG